MKKNFTSIFVMFFVLIFLYESAYAIPAFARKYRMSCQTCHAPFPKLKSYGDEFAGNGFVLSDQQATRYFVDTGDETLSLIRDFPLAVRMEAFVTYKANEPAKGDFKAPYLLKLLSGGSLADNLAYYFYMYFDERGEVAGVEDAYLMFNNLFGSELDLYIGQFQISDPLFKREVRLTMEDYQVYKTKVGASDFNLAYDRGIMLTYGFETGTDIMVEVLNGNGLADADEEYFFDSDNYKNFFGRISQDVGEFLRVGAFGYTGKEVQHRDAFNQLTNTMTMFGPDITFSFEDKVELNLQYVQRLDKWNYINAFIPETEVETKGALAELVYMPEGDNSKWYGVGLFNWVDSDINDLDYKTLALHAGYMLRRNIRIVGEFKYDIKNEAPIFGIGFVSAF
ncbi:MAG: hypothetical protein JW995_15365 [Melioribacteraceae bacterium]|nr:hypothetical protein [Melioribacteraceae bacterium]